MSRVAVIGCGAIGSLYAAHLAREPDVEIWVVDPWADHIDAIEANGLRVTGAADFTARLHARTDPSELPGCDYAILATKASHTRAAIQASQDALRDATVVSLSNGLGNEEVIAEFVSRVVRGSIVTAGAITEPGVVRFDAAGDSWLGPFEPSPADPAQIEALAELLTRSGLPTHARADARGAQWTKVVFNAATSPVAALTGLTIGQVCTDPALKIMLDQLVDEALQVCGAEGITLLRPPAEAMSEAVDEAFWHKPSMLQDVLARRPTEVDALNGAIAAAGRRAGVPTPAHDAMTALVHGLEGSWTRP